MDGWSYLATPLTGVVLGALLLDIRGRLKELNGKFYTHVTDSHSHEAGFARTDEQIKTLFATVKLAHERMDRVDRTRTGAVE